MNFPFVDKILKNNGECDMYGGAIRNRYIGVPATDYDFIVSHITLEHLSDICTEFGFVALHKYLPNALRLHTTGFGIVDIAVPKVTFTQYIAKLDFTMNCIAEDMRLHCIYDSLGGIEDIRNKKIVLNPNQNDLQCSKTVIIRAARFMSQFGFSLDERTRDIFHRDKNVVFDIPTDRLKYEVYKLLSTRNHEIGIALLNELGLYQSLINIYEG